MFFRYSERQATRHEDRVQKIVDDNNERMAGLTKQADATSRECAAAMKENRDAHVKTLAFLERYK